MEALSDPLSTLKKLESGETYSGHYYSLPALEKAGLGKISRLPISVRILLESVLRNCDGHVVTKEDVRNLCQWSAEKKNRFEVPFVVSRIVLQDFTGVPLMVDLAAMRDAVAEFGKSPELIEPQVPVDLVVDHSVQVDRFRGPNVFKENLKKEFERNRERYEFLKWGQQAFEGFSVVPPAIGIVHQVNLEYLAKVVFAKEVGDETLFYPDTLVGTDSHTTMINGLGVAGWGVGGIEAEAGMLGQPIYLEAPEVIGVYLSGRLNEGVTATDLTLRITQMLREENVVGKFVEFFGEGARALTVADRATIANMAPEYGATMGFFPIDEKTLEYLLMTGRTQEQVALVKDYYKAQGFFGIPRKGEVDYTKVLELDLASVVPSVAGPKRPQDCIDVPNLKKEFNRLLEAPIEERGYALRKDKLQNQAVVAPSEDYPQVDDQGRTLRHGSIVIAAITSCTNTSNPSVMIGAALLAKKACERGLKVSPLIKTSLAPGSRVVTEYFEKTDLQQYLDQLGFKLVGYGCTTCIGNSGPLEENIETAIKEGDLVAASVLSGNRNFEARIHGSVRANFLMSPPLVVAYALAGTVDIDLENDPLGKGSDGKDVYLRDIWPTQDEIQQKIIEGIAPEMFHRKYSDILEANPEWKEIHSATSVRYPWDEKSTYIQLPPFFEDLSESPNTIKDIEGMRTLAIFGDSVTTDHISPAGSIPEDGPAGRYLIENGVERAQFNSFGSRRGNDRVMTRGTFANVRIKNTLVGGKEGGWTLLMPEKQEMSIYDACMDYRKRGESLIVFAGEDYGMGSSRDWAAKGTHLLGVKAVVAKSFERIHRSNLLGMGVLPLTFKEGEDTRSLGLSGEETFSIKGLNDDLKPRQEVELIIKKPDGSEQTATLVVRAETPIEVEYYRHGGILPFVLRKIALDSH